MLKRYPSLPIAVLKNHPRDKYLCKYHTPQLSCTVCHSKMLAEIVENERGMAAIHAYENICNLYFLQTSKKGENSSNNLIKKIKRTKKERHCYTKKMTETVSRLTIQHSYTLPLSLLKLSDISEFLVNI